MAGVLEGLARGLRSAGGVISPGVNQIIAQEGLADDAHKRQEQLLRLRAAMEQQTPEYQARVKALENENAYRESMSGLGPDATYDDMARLAVKHGKPEVAAQFARVKEDRAARISQVEEANAMRRVQLERDHEVRLLNARTAQERNAEIARHNRVTEGLTAQNNAVLAELKRLGLDAKGKGRPLPNAAIKELTETGGTATDFQRLTGSFQDSYGGFKAETVGDFDNWLKRNITGDQSGQAQWWQDYQNQKNIVRNKLFGSALTATEKVEFDKAQITPGMRSDQIKLNLKRQEDLSLKAARKLAKAYSAGGYSEEQIEGALGISLKDLGIGGSGGQNASGVIDFGALK